MTKRIQIVVSLFLILGFTGIAQAFYVGPGSQGSSPGQNVGDVLKNSKDDDYVVLQGKLAQKLGKEKYLFSDGTGAIRVEIDNHLFQGQRVAETTVIEIMGEVEKDYMESPEIDVDRMIIITP